MAKSKYRFNTKTLQYEKVKLDAKSVIIKSLPYVLELMFFTATFTYVFNTYFETPERQQLRTENEFLANNLKQIQTKLDVFDQQMNELAKKDNNIYRVIYQMDSVPAQIRNSGYGGVNKYADLKGYQYSKLVIDVSRGIDKLNKKAEVQKRSFHTLAEILQEDEQRMLSLPSIQPIDNRDLTRLSSHYGLRFHPILHIYRMHEGIDLSAPTGTPIYAPGNGKVIKIVHNRTRRGYGNMVVIDHGYDGLTTRYAHLNTILVKEGQTVKRGEQIGTVGNTGLSKGPHLHYEVRKDGKSVNPLHYILELSPEQYDILLEAAKLPGKSFD